MNGPVPRGMVSSDDGDWGLLRSGRYRYVSVRGALVVDTSDFHAGSGDLEIGEPIRHLGSHQVSARLHRAGTATLTVEVRAEGAA